MQPKTKAHLALIGTNIFFAINFTAVKYLINNGFVKAFGINFIRISITAILFWIIYLFKRRKINLQKKHLLRFLLCAITGIVINQLLFIKGLSLTYSIHASLLMLITPILITFIAAWLLKEKLSYYKLSGLFLGLTGATILVFAKAGKSEASNYLLGDLLVLLNAVSYSFYFILVKPLMHHYKALDVIRILFTIGFFIAFPFCWKEFNEIPWHLFMPLQWLVLSLVVIGGTFCAYLFNIYGIKILGASVSGSYIYSQPFFATFIAMFFLHEKLDLYKIIAAICIFSGVYLANKYSSAPVDSINE